MATADYPRPVQVEVTARNLIGGAAGYTLAQATTAVAGLVSMRISLEYLGGLEYSVLLLAATVSGWGVLGNLGLGNAVRQRMTRHLANGETLDAARCLSSGVATLAVIAVVLALTFLVVHSLGLTTYLLKGENVDVARGTRLLLLGVALFLVRFPFNPLGAAILARNQLVAHNAFTIFMQCTRPLVLWLTLRQTRSLEVVLIVQHLHMWVDLALRYGFVLWQVPELRISLKLASRATARSLLLPSVSFFVISMGTIVIYSTGNAVIGGVVGVEYIVGYVAAFRLFNIVRVFCISGIEVLFPAAAILDAKGQRERLQGLIVKTSRMALTLSVLGGGGIAFLAGPAITVWFDGQLEHPPSAGTLLALGALLPVGVFINCVGRGVTGIGRHQRQAVIFIVEMVLNVGLSIYLASLYGVLGVALGILLARMLMMVPYAVDAVRTLGLNAGALLGQAVLPALLVAVPVASAGLAIPVAADTGLTQLLTIAGGYAGVCVLILALVTPQDVRQKLWKKLRGRPQKAAPEAT